ncbi:MAG: competence/damage-inducible protein A [Ignavibacteria bacterium]|nr:competence/damage-inducible protein A [Ignavibacteria bacterium]
MKAFIISVGDELLIGQTVNTNASFLAEQLTKYNYEVVKISVVGDDEQAILDELDYSVSLADVIFVTGGLGPTHDDITKKCLQNFFDKSLVVNPEVLNDVRLFFQKRGKTLTKINEDQALVLEDATVFRNLVGTAPGMLNEKNGKFVITMPGVPFEMKSIFENSVLPYLTEKYPQNKIIIKQLNLLTTGIAESILYEKLGDLAVLLSGAKLAFLPNEFGVKMRITVTASSEEEAESKILEIEQKIRAIVGRYIYGKGDATIEEVVARLLIDRGLKLGVAESCTGGLICNRLTNVPGSSNFFERGIITYSNGAKVELLNVNEDFIHNYGAVSLEVARQMAEGVRKCSGTDIGVASTGIMGPSGATENKPIGLVYIGICDDKICTAKEFHFGDDRILNKIKTSQAAIEMLRRYLLGIPYDE